MTYPDQSQYQQSILSAEDNFDELTHLRPVMSRWGTPYMDSGNLSVVFRMTDGRKDYAVKCFTRHYPGRAEAYRKISRSLAPLQSPYIVDIAYLDDELFVDVPGSSDDGNYPVLKMEWVDGVPLDKYVDSILSDGQQLRILADRFDDMACWLLRQPLAHGDLKPDNILVRSDGSLTLVDYDGMYVPSMCGEKARETGTPPYSHRLRKEQPFDGHADDYAIVVISLILRALSLHPQRYGVYERALTQGSESLLSLMAERDLLGDARLCSVLAAYHIVETYGVIDASVATLLFTLGASVEAHRLMLSGAALPPKPTAPTAAQAKKNELNGHAYVDLGLSVKWATTNVGADKPEQYGDYYAWGETQTKSSYDEDNCETYNKNISDIGGTIRDVAHVKWGGPWRMPTVAEFDELCDGDNCAWQWTTMNGINGYKVTSKKAGYKGNSIFLPAAGWQLGTSPGRRGQGGYYWSSTPGEGGAQVAYRLNFNSGLHRTYWNSRYLGHTVRPVAEF